MPNLAGTLKDEIRRLARKEVKAATGTMQKSVVQYRREIAGLKRTLQAQEKEIAALAKRQENGQSEPAMTGEAEEKVRYSAKSVRSQRKRLGLSAADFAKLVGVAPLTIYQWEHGKNRPRKAQLQRLVAVRDIGRREAQRRLEALPSQPEPATKNRRKLARKKLR